MKTNYQLNKPYRYYSIYRQEWVEFTSKGIYEHRFVNNCRYPKTTQERRWNDAHKEFVRGKRRNLPTTWDDLRPSFGYGSDWKRFTKKRKQYL